MASSEQDEPQSDFNINTHRFKFVPPDIVRVWWDGACSNDEMRYLMELTARRYGDRDYFVIADVSKLVVDSMMREHVARNPQIKRIAGLALLGASFHTRVIIAMMSRAMGFLYGGSFGKFGAFNTELEAIGWITKERELRKSR